MVVTTPWGGCSCAGHFRCFCWWAGDCLFLARFDHQSDRMSTTLVLLLASAAAGRGQRRSRGSLLLEVGIDVNFARLLGTWKRAFQYDDTVEWSIFHTFSVSSHTVVSLPYYTTLFSLRKKIISKLLQRSEVFYLKCQKVHQYCKPGLKYWLQGINGPLDPSGGQKIQCFIRWKGLLVS